MAGADHDDMKDPPSGTPDGVTVVSMKSSRARARSKRPTSSDSSNPRAITSSGSHSVHTSGTPLSASQRADVLTDVLLGDERNRAHGFALAIGWIAFSVACALPFLDGHPIAKTWCGGALIAIVLSSIWAYERTRPGMLYNRRAHRLYGTLITTAVVAVEYYCGVFSPVALIVTLGVYFLGQSADHFQSLGLTVYVCASYVVLALLITFHVVPDVGLFDASGATLTSHLFGVVAVTAVLAITVRMARVSRASMREAIERSNDAILASQQREALLLEAQQHLERALHVAVGKPGVHTGKLAGSYRLGIVIGVGAMGEIYEAVRETDGVHAAIKLMQANAAERDDLVKRFLREAEICQRLNNPHIVRVFDSGTMEDGASYMAMELLRGTDLAAHLRKHGAMPLHDVVGLAHDLGVALTHAHEAGVVHRDLKPVNVFLAEDEDNQSRRWKILDFGISKLTDSSGTLTNVGIVGTPGYMSPEQAQGHAVDTRSDVFSMCVVLYRALTGRPAFTGNDTPQIMFEVVYKSPMRPTLALESLPPELDIVFAIGLAKKPEDRWATAQELAEALDGASRGKVRDEWRSRARKILKAQPWGEPVKVSKS